MKAKKKLIGLMLVGLCTVLGIGFVVTAAGSKGGASATADKAGKARTADVLVVVAESIPLGTRSDSQVLKSGVVVKTLSSDQVPEKAIHSLDELAAMNGQLLTVALIKGDKLDLTKFDKAGSYGEAANAVKVDPALLQVSFALEPQRVMGGRLRAGDRVAVLGSFGPQSTEDKSNAASSQQVTHLILSKVMVANVQTENPAANPEDANAKDQTSLGVAVKGNLTVTLAMDAASAEKMAFTLEFGKVWLATIPADAKTEGVGIQTRDSVLGIAPAVPQAVK